MPDPALERLTLPDPPPCGDPPGSLSHAAVQPAAPDGPAPTCQLMVWSDEYHAPVVGPENETEGWLVSKPMGPYE